MEGVSVKQMSKTAVAILAGGALVVGLFVASVVPIRNFVDGLFGRDTYTATGDVVLKKLQESQTLEVAKGTFDVPVVVCNERADAYEDRRSAEDLLKTCNGAGDEKATLIVEAQIQALIQLDDIRPDDVSIDGKRIQVTVPSPTLGEPSVDAENGVLIVAIDTSIFPGKLPDDYLARASKEGKAAVASVAEESGLLDIGEKSTRSIFEGLLKSFGFTDVQVDFQPPS